jgi:hypothetical protein
MSIQRSDGFARGQRIQDYCKAIWGDGYYELDVDTEDDDHYGYIRKELEDSYGPLLLDSGRCRSIDEACNELERMLANECKAREGK